MADTNADKIMQKALEPVSISNETGSATDHSISSQIEADRYQRTVNSAKRDPMMGIKFVKVRNAPASGVNPDE